MYAGGFGNVKGHMGFVEAGFVCLHWQMDGVCMCVGSRHSWRLTVSVPQTQRTWRKQY